MGVCTPSNMRFGAFALLVNVVSAVVSRFAVLAGRDRYLRQLATALNAVVILAGAHVAHYGLLILHFAPPATSLHNFAGENTV